ncbi:MAG TPA: GntR family transcriptional regulator [Rhodopila sp.]|uniref:GntR family transcriptional regulator n=1 Tax=Rhodopila sp. TaxID=2480087 RepID=UPI002CE23703|nr:GntR family transcriptional regulator [Rhodopila sp.]HVY15594.1 GntR family transcriptional regulator [Rhodopila sp.]
MTKGRTAAGVHRIKRQSLPETLAESLRERILNGEFREGDQLIQEAIADEYEVSRMPVREALRQLEALGLIVMKTHKGAVVTAMPQETVAELFDLRVLLECDILKHALPRFTDADAAVAAAILVSLEEAYHRRDISAWGGLNWQFHKSLYTPANRPETLAVIEQVNVKTDRFIRLQLLMTGGIADAEQEHRELLQLCKARDKRAVDFLRKHIAKAGKMPLPKSTFRADAA